MQVIKNVVLIFLQLGIGINHHTYAQLESIQLYYQGLEKEQKKSPQTIQFISEDMGLVEDYSKLSQIILLRHGEPSLNKKGWRKREEAKKFIRDYDSVGIYTPDFIPILLSLDDINVIHTSSLNRSITTSQEVFKREDIQQPNPMFREFERKIFAFPNIKLPLKWWLTGSRILWFMGLNKKGIERFSDAKERAMIAAAFLDKDARSNGKSLLVSHGLLNHYLVKYLKQKGWIEVFDGGKGYLSQKMLVKLGN